MPSPRSVQSGTLLETDDTRLLFDCGSGVVHRLAQANVEEVTELTTTLVLKLVAPNAHKRRKLREAQAASQQALQDAFGQNSTT